MDQLRVESHQKELNHYINLFFFELRNHMQEIDYLQGCVFQITNFLFSILQEEQNIRAKEWKFSPELEARFSEFREFVSLHKRFNSVDRRINNIKNKLENIPEDKNLTSKLKVFEAESEELLKQLHSN